MQKIHLNDLNDAQKEAVLHKDGPLLIVAGAGAGKTRVITHRIINLINEGIDPHRILAITFTNKAANEMKERVEKMLEGKGHKSYPLISTFHSLGVRILKENYLLVGIPRHFAIFDRSDSLRAVKEAMRSLQIETNKYEPKNILAIISRLKNGQISLIEKRVDHSDEFSQIIKRVVDEYDDILKKEGALDFDDLLLKPLKLLKKEEVVRKRYQDTWHYLHIDEYQDTNKVQYEMARLLVGKEQNICAVGDIDQNIYSFRGSDIKNILNFEKDFANSQIVLLEENYRSSKTIISAANEVIKKNKKRKEKNLFTQNPAGEKISIYSAYDETDEARFIASKAGDLIASGTSPEEIAVLYRANFQSRALEEAFLDQQVPYQVLGVRFFDRKEVKDVLSYIRASLNSQSRIDLSRIINVPRRGIGRVTLSKVLSGKENELNDGMKKKIDNFKFLLLKIKDKIENNSPSEVIKFVIKESGMEDALKNGSDEDKERLENLGELVSLSQKYDMLELPQGIEKLLESAALATDQDSLEDKSRAVRLMTVHAAKGLEFDNVFICGLENDLFPHKKYGQTNVTEDEIEEERRLFYVALTRARKKAFLTYASVRSIFGSKQINLPSEFLSDIDEDHLEESEPAKGSNLLDGFLYID